MDLISLRYFTALAKNLHFTKTAQELFITQQNLSQHIKKLEDYYGTVLIERKPKLRLTPAGEALLEAARKIQTESDNILLQLNDMKENNVGTLSFGASQYRGTYWIPLVLPEYIKKWPNVQVKLTMEPSRKMEQLLLAGSLDFFVGIKEGDDPFLRTIPLMKDKVYLAVSKGLLEKSFGQNSNIIINECLSGTSLRKFQNVPFIRLNTNYRLRLLMDQCFKEAGFKPKQVIEVPSIEMMISMLPYDIGAFFCTGMRLKSIQEKYPDVLFFPVLLEGKFIYNSLSIVYHKDKYFPAYSQDFIQRLQAFFAPFSEANEKINIEEIL